MLKIVNPDKLHTQDTNYAYSIAQVPAGASHQAGAIFSACVLSDHKILIEKYKDAKKGSDREFTLDYKTSRAPALCVRDDKLYLAYRAYETKDTGDDKPISFAWIHLKNEIDKKDHWHNMVLDGKNSSNSYDVTYVPEGFAPHTDARPSFVGHGGDHGLWLAFKTGRHTLGLARYDTDTRTWYWAKNSADVMKELDVHHEVLDGKAMGTSRRRDFELGVRPISKYTIDTSGGVPTPAEYRTQREIWEAELHRVKNDPTIPDQKRLITLLEYQLATTPVDNFFHSEKEPALGSLGSQLFLAFKDNHRADPGIANPLLFGVLRGTWPPLSQEPWDIRLEGRSHNRVEVDGTRDRGPGTRVQVAPSSGGNDVEMHYGPALASAAGRLYCFYSHPLHKTLTYVYLDPKASSYGPWQGPFTLKDADGGTIDCSRAPNATTGKDDSILVSTSYQNTSMTWKSRFYALKEG